MTQRRPQPGTWYETDEGEIFLVDAFEPTHAWVDVRYLNGTVGTLDLAAWDELELRVIEPPEGWQASMDELGTERLA